MEIDCPANEILNKMKWNMKDQSLSKIDQDLKKNYLYLVSKMKDWSGILDCNQMLDLQSTTNEI